MKFHNVFFFVLVLVFVACPSFRLATAAADDKVSASLRITDGDRPLTLYEAPSTGRRDARGRRVKSIIIVSKNPATESRDKSNAVAPWSAGPTTTTATSTTTTASPAEKITIPFFSISCSVGSSCSQIISAREAKTPRPTFRPYTKEEIAKFKGPLSLLFPPKNQTTTSTTKPPLDGTASSTAAATTTAHPWKLQTWTLGDNAPQAPTVKPTSASSSSIWRIRTTTQRPAYVMTTAAPSVKPITLKPFTISSQFQFGTQTTASRSTTTTTTTEAPRRKIWSPYDSKPVKNYYNNFAQLQKPAAVPDPWPVKTNSESRVRPTWVNGRPVYDYSATAEKTPTKPSLKFPEFQTWSSPFQQKENYRPVAWSQNKDTSSAVQPKPRPQEVFFTNPNPVTWKPRPQETFYTNPKTNSKVALITAASASRGPPVPVRPPLPAEVSVSSAVVGLRVAPKSLSEPAFIERVNGHLIETDGRDENLDALIMQLELPRPPRARMLHYNQPIRNDNSRKLGRRYNYHERDSWQPIIFPRI